MSFLTRGRMRFAATALTAGALAATTLAFTSSPASADEGSSPELAATVSFDDGVDITVEGSGFNPASRPGASGVYVAVAEKQDIFNIPAEEAMSAFFAQDWVMPMHFTDGAFTRTIGVEPADVQAGKEYAVYTWTAHGTPTAGDSQYTETDVELVQAPTLTATAKVSGKYVDVTIKGAHFDPASRPGAMGVYVGLSKKRNIFGDESDDQQSGMELFVGSDWVMPTQFTDGAFTKTLTVPTAKLTKGFTYAVYTWTAHGNPTAGDSQYTQSVINVAGLPKNKAKATVKIKKKPTTRKKGVSTVTIKGVQGVKVSGKVRLGLKKGKQAKWVKAKLNKAGKVTVKLPKLKKGKWTITARYYGNLNYKAAKKAVKVKIRK